MDDLFKNSNITEKSCPLCGKKLKYRRPCCSSKDETLFCICGYKEIYVKDTGSGTVGGSTG